MEERMAEIERRMGDWEVTRNRMQRRANFWFSVLTLVVIASPFLATPPEDEEQPAPAHAAGVPHLRFGRLGRVLHWTRWSKRPVPGSHHNAPIAPRRKPA